jgi:hypothetical protein
MRASSPRSYKMMFPDHRPPPRGDQLSDVPEVFASDVIHACATEMAVTVTDVSVFALIDPWR